MDLSFDQLNQSMQNTIDSAFHLKRVNIILHLLPSQLGNEKQEISKLLGTLLFIYSEEFGGIPLSHHNTKLLSTYGNILNELRHIHFPIQADFLVFTPKEGMILKATITKIFPDRVCLLYLGLFNVQVAIEDTEYQFNKINNSLESNIEEEGSLNEGDFATFKVKTFRNVRRGNLLIIGHDVKPNNDNSSKKVKKIKGTSILKRMDQEVEKHLNREKDLNNKKEMEQIFTNYKAKESNLNTSMDLLRDDNNENNNTTLYEEHTNKRSKLDSPLFKNTSSFLHDEADEDDEDALPSIRSNRSAAEDDFNEEDGRRSDDDDRDNSASDGDQLDEYSEE